MLLGEDDTPDKTLLETRMVRANLKSRKGILAQVPKDGEFFLCSAFQSVFHLYFICYIQFIFFSFLSFLLSSWMSKI